MMYLLCANTEKLLPGSRTSLFKDACSELDAILESAFAPNVGFGVLMTSKLGTNVILMRDVAAISPMKELKS
jgi:hypothetical protein